MLRAWRRIHRMGDAMSPGDSVAVATWYSSGWNRWWLWRSSTRHAHWRLAQGLGGAQPAETAADDDDMWHWTVC